jgi:arylsulfatase
VLAHLEQLWWAAAGRYQVLPVDTRKRSERWPSRRPVPLDADADRSVFRGTGGPYERGVAPHITGRSFRLKARITVTSDEPPTGMLLALGGLHGGIWWYLADGEMRLESAPTSISTQTVATPVRLGPGDHVLAVEVEAGDGLDAQVRFEVDGHFAGRRELGGLLGRVPIGSGRMYVGRAQAPSVAGTYTPPFDLTVDLHELLVTAGDEVPTVAAAEPAAEMRDQ